jgi:hypothetical protein
MKTRTDLDKLLTSAGLLALGTGFAALGFLSFVNKGPEDAESAMFFDATYPMIGSLTSILVGAAFFTIAVLFMATLLRGKRSSKFIGRIQAT